MLAFVLAGVLVAASGTDSADLQQNSTQNPPAQTESVSTAIPGIGTVVELKGTATAKSKNGSTRELAEGDAVYADETLETSSDSTLQIELNDESLFTLSQNTQMSVNDFVYEEGSVKANMGANVVKGVFRYVSGKVEKLNPENVNIEIPSGTIGIRGTIVVGEIEGEKCLVALEPEEGSAVQHRIVISGNSGGQKQEVEITKPGFATMIEGRGQAPKPVYQMAESDMNRFQQKLPRPPKFPEGTKPGTPERYQHLFDPSKMMERRQSEEMRKTSEGQPGQMEKKNESFENRDEDEGKKSADDRDQKPGPKPPQGPDGNDGSDLGGGPDQSQNPANNARPDGLNPRDSEDYGQKPQMSFQKPFGGFHNSDSGQPQGQFSPPDNSSRGQMSPPDQGQGRAGAQTFMDKPNNKAQQGGFGMRGAQSQHGEGQNRPNGGVNGRPQGGDSHPGGRPPKR